jgi:transcriptional regulator GlxA family with amidase domain
MPVQERPPLHEVAVLALKGVPGLEPGLPHRFLGMAAAGHARLVSVCTGASVLAAAGLLDGRPGTTHWRDTELFRRTFTRRFREETAMSPQQWLTIQRLALVRQLLESTDLPLDRVAGNAGFGTPASLRAHLRGAIGVAPLACRRSLRAPGTRPI